MLTTGDWIKRAREGGEASSCLAQAEDAARWPDDWNALAAAWMEFADEVSARRCVETALEQAQGEHWPSRRAAEFLLNRLGDRRAAGAALGRIEARLLSPMRGVPTRAYQWVLLARAYQEVLGETDAARQCLEGAAVGASTPDDLTALAGGSAWLDGEGDGTRNLLERAERLARERGELRALWTVALGWKEHLHDDARARELLESATAETSDLSTLISLTVAWESMFHDEEAIRRALARGETLATHPEDWLELAEGYRDGGQDSRGSTWEPGAVRRCLEAALTTEPPPTAPQRERIAVAFQRWLGESVRAAEIAPTRRLIEAVVKPRRHLEGWPARSPRALLERLRARIGSEDLEILANADHGSARDKHHQALVEIQTTGTFPLPLDWYPGEVLALSRWERGADTSHVRRAFACAVLGLDATLADSTHGGTLPDVLAPLLESAWALGLDDELELFLVWLVEVIEWEEERPWTLFALVLSLARRAPGDPRLGLLVEQLEALGTPDADLETLMRHNRSVGYADLWRALATGLLDPARGVPPHLELLVLYLPDA